MKSARKPITAMTPEERVSQEITLFGATREEMWSLFTASRDRCKANEKLFENVKTFCMFVGHPRSGHSLVSALLDAHPNIIIAHELDALRCFCAGFSTHQVFQLLIENSRQFAKLGRRWGNYSYSVPNQFQGRFTELRVIGDKKGGETIMRLQRMPWLLDAFRDALGTELKLIQVVRDPYDNIAAIALKNTRDLRLAVQYYFDLCETIAEVRQKYSNNVLLEVRHESMIRDPVATLTSICNFLGVSVPQPYLTGCASIVFDRPQQSRTRVDWDSEAVDFVRRRAQDISFLRDYVEGP